MFFFFFWCLFQIKIWLQWWSTVALSMNPTRVIEVEKNLSRAPCGNFNIMNLRNQYYHETPYWIAIHIYGSQKLKIGKNKIPKKMLRWMSSNILRQMCTFKMLEVGSCKRYHLLHSNRYLTGLIRLGNWGENEREMLDPQKLATELNMFAAKEIRS